jgi:hypothetical protein
VGAKALAKARAKVREDAVEVEPENARAVRLFLALTTQWRYAPRTNGKMELLQRTGLDYAVLPAVSSALAIALDETLLAQLRILEGKTIEIHGERQRHLFSSS